MKFGTHVALPKHILTAKYEIEIHMYSDVTPFCDSSLFKIFYFLLSGLPTLNIFYPTDLNEI